MDKKKIFAFACLVVLAVGTVALIIYLSKKQRDDYIIAARFDPEIYEKSGGMAGYSTYPYDTSPYGGYVNYPYVIYNSPWYYPRWRRRYRRYFPRRYLAGNIPYGAPDNVIPYLPNSLYRRTYYDRPYW